MKLRMRLILLLSIISAFAVVGCSNNVAGNNSGGTEITNGRVVARSGAAAEGLTVEAYPVSFIRGRSLPASVITAVTEHDGTFALALDSGHYNVFVIDSVSGSGVFVNDVGPKTDMGVMQLDSLGEITGVIRTDKTVSSLIVYSRGTPFRDDIHLSDSSFSFGRVPPGSYELSIAKEQIAGCAPGEDCIPGGSAPSVSEGLIVLPGTPMVIDTLVNTQLVGTLP